MDRSVLLFMIACALCLESSSRASTMGYQFPKSPPVTMEQINTIIKNPAVNSIDAFLGQLPESYLQHYTLTFNDDSLQKGTMENPRAIVFGLDAKLIMTFNGDPNAEGYGTLEIMQFDDLTQKFRLFEIQESNGKLELQSDPPKCAACHGEPPKPIWQNYPHWLKTYGSQDDTYTPYNRMGQLHDTMDPRHAFKDVSEEGKKFLVWKSSYGLKGRYRHLPKKNEIDRYFPYGTPTAGANSLRPNMRLGKLLNRLNWHAIAQKIYDDPFYKENELMFLFLMGECDQKSDLHGIDELKDETVLKMKKEFRLNIQEKYGREIAEDADPLTLMSLFTTARDFSFTSQKKPGGTFTDPASAYQPGVVLHILFEKSKMKKPSGIPSYTVDDYYPRKNVTDPNDGGADHLFNHDYLKLLEILESYDLDISPENGKPGTRKLFCDAVQSLLSQGSSQLTNDGKVCQSNSAQPLPEEQKRKVENLKGNVAPQPEVRKVEVTEIIAECKSCHSDKSNHIPFDHPKQILKMKSKSGRPLLEEIKYRISSEAWTRNDGMPYGKRPLENSEADALMKALTSSK